MAIEILSYEPKRRPRHRLIYRELDGIYSGWTGFELFGLIWPFRYYGFRVTCWATVMARMYGSARTARFFESVEEAASELERLMNIAEHHGELATKPVPSWSGEPWRHPLWMQCGLKSITPHIGDRMRARTATSDDFKLIYTRNQVAMKGSPQWST